MIRSLCFNSPEKTKKKAKRKKAKQIMEAKKY